MIVSIPELYWWCCALTTMRLSLWFVLILAFSVGMCCALAVRFLYFEAMPVVVQASEPTTRILVATRTIPSGIEITADFVSFQEVPISEVPPGVLTSFSQVYRRQPAFPIPVGCPICEDLLLPLATTVQQAAFVPTGSQIVALDITHIRQGNRVFSTREPLSTVLSDDQRIDIRVVPPETQGRLAEKRNEVLRTFVAQDIRSRGELILEDVQIHQIQRQLAVNHTGSTMDSLQLMLDESEAARLTAAARRGQLRIIVRQDEMPSSQPSESPASNIFDIADSRVQPLPDSLLSLGSLPSGSVPPGAVSSGAVSPGSLSLVQSLSLDIPNTQHSPPTTAFDPAIPEEHVQRTAPVPADIFDPVLPQPPAVAAVDTLPFGSAEEVSQNAGEQPPDELAVFAPLELPTQEVDPIRNEGMVTFGFSFRNVAPPTDTAMEQNLSPTQVSSPTDEPGQEAPVPPSSERAMGLPRISNTIQFLPPGSLAPVREQKQVQVQVHEQVLAHEQEAGKVLQIESAAMLESATLESATTSPIISSGMPFVIPAPATQERVPGYSPFERRIYTVLPDEERELQAPQRLSRTSDAGAQTQ